MSGVVISSGHGLYVRGASGYIDEVDEARRVVEEVATQLRLANISVTTVHDDVSRTQSENLEWIVDQHNALERDLDVSVHFNAYETTDKPMGTEVLFCTAEDLADSMSEAIAQAGDFIDRGPKYRDDLYFLHKTNEPAILIETCFVDSKPDSEQYDIHFNHICYAIAATIFRALGGGMLAPRNQRDITASVFGGSDDPNYSAYPPFDENGNGQLLNDTDFYIALPDRFEAERPLVKVYCGGKSAVAEIWDVGPWNTNDPYWATGCRPAAESGIDEKGRETNGAGIDLSPALAEALGVDGMGKVDWKFL